MARADRMRAVVAAPASIMAPYWAPLVAASLPAGSEPFQKFLDPMSLLEHSADFRVSALALFTVDFGAACPPGSDSGFAPRCGYEARLRGRPVLGSASDVADRERIRFGLRQRLRPDGC